ncbi:MAG TPA: hypothetical protein PLI96_03700 [Halothiobacillus sp.]|nr:hypothetical protein [Halothiobacillus sp.]
MHTENLFLPLSGSSMMDAEPFFVNGFARFLLVDKASFGSFFISNRNHHHAAKHSTFLPPP